MNDLFSEQCTKHLHVIYTKIQIHMKTMNNMYTAQIGRKGSVLDCRAPLEVIK